MKDFLLTHYEHLSKLWERRDQMRIAFLRFYFLFLGAMAGAIGVLARIGVFENGSTESLLFVDLLKSPIFKLFMAVVFFVGFFTFFLIIYIRRHNLKCTHFMNEVAKWFDRNNNESIGNTVTKPFVVQFRKASGIDFTNLVMLAIFNSLVLSTVFYGISVWVMVVIAIVSFLCHVGCWCSIGSRATREYRND